MAAPAAVPAAAAGIVGIFATASVVVGRLAGSAEVTAPPAGRSPVALPAAVEVTAAVAAAAAAAGAVEASSRGVSRDQPLGDWLGAEDPGSLGAALFLVVGVLAGVLVVSDSISSTIVASLSAKTL